MRVPLSSHEHRSLSVLVVVGFNFCSVFVAYSDNGGTGEADSCSGDAEDDAGEFHVEFGSAWSLVRFMAYF